MLLTLCTILVPVFPFIVGKFLDETKTDAAATKVVDLQYTQKQFAKIGVKKKDAAQDEWEMNMEEEMDALAWLCNWFLSAVISAELWKAQATAVGKEQRVDIFDWATPDDIAFLAAVFQSNYRKWKKQADYKREGKEVLSKEEKAVARKLGEFGKDGLSSENGQKRMNSLRIHIGLHIMSQQEHRKAFNDKFWLYYDEHILPNIVAPQLTTDNSHDGSMDAGESEKEAQEEELDSMMFTNYATNVTAL